MKEDKRKNSGRREQDRRKQGPNAMPPDGDERRKRVRRMAERRSK